MTQYGTLNDDVKMLENL